MFAIIIITMQRLFRKTIIGVITHLFMCFAIDPWLNDNSQDEFKETKCNSINLLHRCNKENYVKIYMSAVCIHKR